jgi:hypothetical protein
MFDDEDRAGRDKDLEHLKPAVNDIDVEPELD